MSVLTNCSMNNFATVCCFKSVESVLNEENLSEKKMDSAACNEPLTLIRLCFLRVVFSGGCQFDPSPFIFQEKLI